MSLPASTTFSRPSSPRSWAAWTTAPASGWWWAGKGTTPACASWTSSTAPTPPGMPAPLRPASGSCAPRALRCGTAAPPAPAPPATAASCCAPAPTLPFTRPLCSGRASRSMPTPPPTCWTRPMCAPLRRFWRSSTTRPRTWRWRRCCSAPCSPSRRTTWSACAGRCGAAACTARCFPARTPSSKPLPILWPSTAAWPAPCRWTR